MATGADNAVQIVRVLALNFEPTVPSEGNQTLWQIFGWSDPRQLASGYIADMEYAGGGAVDYQLVEWRDLNEFPIFTDGSRYTADQYVQNRRTNTGWSNASADFYALARQQGLADLINTGAIDEIWTFGDHYFSLFGEAWMVGPASFFINGPTFPNLAVDRAVAGYGFSYERGVAEMLHNHGHRTENHMSRAYGYNWNLANPVTPWDYFTANAGQTNRDEFGVGNTHYPFNAASDYDYANGREFPSYADDFVENFPNQTYAAIPLTREAWGDMNIGDWQRGYLRWFFGHVPRGAGQAADGRQNNWYKYIYDFNSYRPSSGLPRDDEAILGATGLVATGQDAYEFTLRYYDVQGIDVDSLGDDDLLVTGPGGFSRMATVANVGPELPTTSGTARTVRYRIAPEDGSWDANDAGSYSVRIRANAVEDKNGEILPAAHLGSFFIQSDGAAEDVAAPTALLTAAPIAVGNDRASPFVVQYSDDQLIDISSISFGDVRITGPGGFVQTAALYGLDANQYAAQRDVTYFVIPPGGNWDSSDNGSYVIEMASGQVFDLAGNPVASGQLGTFMVDLPAPEMQPLPDMTESNAGDWYAWAAGATAETFDDTQRKLQGEASVRFETTGGFDTFLRYEPSHGVRWDLTYADRFLFSLYAENPSPFGFQVEPIVTLTDIDGNSVTCRYWRNGSPHALWNDARANWLAVQIPLKSDSQPATGWRAAMKGDFDWSRVQSVEIHTDTWDSGFTLWLDRMRFNFNRPGDVNRDQVVDAADLDLFAAQIRSGGFDAQFDLVANGVIDSDDINYVIGTILQTTRGDLDLDGDVDSADLLQMLGGWTGVLTPGSGPSGWSTGDVDGDADTDSNDLLGLLEFWTGSAESARPRWPHPSRPRAGD